MAVATRKHTYDLKSAIPYIVTHLMPLGALWVGVTWEAVLLCVALFWFRMWAVTAVYHRYFAHRTYKTSRPFQFLLAVCATLATQRGPLWWAAHHRAHHLYSDTERDLHSPKQDGFWHAHVGWVFEDDGETDWKRIQDFAKYPELRWLNKYHLLPTVLLGILIVTQMGWPAVLTGFFLSQVLAWHATNFINSLCHVWGKRRFDTSDTSRNNLFLALITCGEGWHNNHHHYMNSARQGFYWWEIDLTYYVLKVFSWVGLVWDLKVPPQRVLEEGRRLDEAKRRSEERPAVGELAAARTSLIP